MSTIIDLMINAVESKRQQAVAEKQLHIKMTNDERLAKAQADLTNVLGKAASALLPVIETHTDGNSDGFIVSVDWMFGGDALQLAPTRLTWYPGGVIYGHRDNYVTALVVDGNRNQQWCEGVTQAEFFCILHAARQAYEPWKASIAARKAKERQAKISDLIWPNLWGWHRSEEEVAARYVLLAKLDPVLAEEKLAMWHAEVEAHAQDQQQRALAKASADTARAEYKMRLQAWQEECRQWAEQEQARLWTPWTLWEVRYAPFDARLIRCDDDNYDPASPIETIMTLDAPADIVVQCPVALVDKVDLMGRVTSDFAIGAFLDAEPVHYEEPTSMHHRSFFAGDYEVHVPAIVLEDPAPAPVRPEMPSVLRDSLPF